MHARSRQSLPTSDSQTWMYPAIGIKTPDKSETRPAAKDLVIKVIVRLSGEALVLSTILRE